jgi:hypothetical protein
MFFISCANNKTELERLFDEHMNLMGQEKVELFKSAKTDSSCRILDVLSSEINSIYREILNRNDLNKSLESIPLLKDSTNKKIYLTVSLHEYLKGGHLVSSEVEQEFKRVLHCYEDKIIMSNAIENERIARVNFETVFIGDTLSLVFPVDNNHGHPRTYFKGGYPYSNDYSQADDSLSLLVVLTDKFQGEKTGLSPINNSSLYFKVRIVATSNSNVEIRTGSMTGNEFAFCLQFYGRVIR